MLDNTEQITRDPVVEGQVVATNRVKDPKRVAVGKKLAEKNKQMREEHAKYKEMEAESNKRMREENAQYKAAEEETSGSSLSDGFLSQLTFGNVISLIGVGLTIYALFYKEGGAKGETKAQDAWSRPVETTL